MGKKILVIDDAASIRQVVSMVLAEEGYDIIEAVDGVDGLEKLKGSDVDIIVCDVNMPNMNGVEFLEQVKTNEEFSSYKFLPFIMLTTEAGQEMKEKGKKLGAKAWLVKPFQPEMLIDAVKKLVG